MTKERKNFIYMWLPVAAFILGALAVQHDIASLFLVFGAYALCLLVTMWKAKTLKPKQAANMIKAAWPQDEAND